MDEWKNDEICMKALGKEVVEKYLELKIQEWKEYEIHMASHDSAEVTPWEIQKYLYF